MKKTNARQYPRRQKDLVDSTMKPCARRKRGDRHVRMREERMRTNDVQKRREGETKTPKRAFHYVLLQKAHRMTSISSKAMNIKNQGTMSTTAR